MLFKRIPKDIRYKGIANILIIGLSSIGDNLLISPAIKLLKDTYKDACFDIVVGPRAVDFAKGNPVFSNIYVWDKKTGISNLVRMLKDKKYDIVVDFRNSIIPFFIKTKYRMTFFKEEFFSRKFFTHESERTMKFFEPYFGRPAKIELYFPLSNQEISEYRDFFMNTNILTPGRRVITITPGAAFEKKRWDKEKFAKVAALVVSQFDVNIVISGNSKEYDLAEEIRIMINNDRVFNLAGKITFRQLAYILSQSSLLITNDTGTMHLASAMKCPVVAIFGPGNPLRYGPIGTKNFVLHTKRTCFPCKVESKCKKGFVCMEDVSVEDVMMAVSMILQAS